MLYMCRGLRLAHACSSVGDPVSRRPQGSRIVELDGFLVVSLSSLGPSILSTYFETLSYFCLSAYSRPVDPQPPWSSPFSIFHRPIGILELQILATVPSFLCGLWGIELTSSFLYSKHFCQMSPFIKLIIILLTVLSVLDKGSHVLPLKSRFCNYILYFYYPESSVRKYGCHYGPNAPDIKEPK